MRIPKVSVGIQVFNGEQFLRKPTESIINQNYKDTLLSQLFS